MMTRDEFRGRVNDLAMSAWTAGAIGAAFASGLADAMREPRTIDELAAACPKVPRERLAAIAGVLVAEGIASADGEKLRLADGAAAFLGEPMRAALVGGIESALLQPRDLIDACERPRGWRHVDAAVLQAQGAESGGFAPMFKAAIVPALEGLAERLEKPGARFLDVGVGVAAISIAMCRAWPTLSVVGLDVFDPSLALARENVARAGLASRIELRRCPVEDLDDDAAFDLVWLPAVFLDEPTVRAALARLHAAMRPGAWILVAAVGAETTARDRAVRALQRELWGGSPLAPSDAEALVRGARFESTRIIDGPPWAPGLVVGRRA